jgi:hypothetical protein
LDRSLRYWNNAQIYRFARGAPLSLLIASVIVAIITIPKKKTSSPIVKEKRKAGTRAGLTKAAIVAAAAKLIESVGANGFSLRKLAKALGVGPTAIQQRSIKGGSRGEAALSVVRGVRAPTGGYLTPRVVMSRSAYSATTSGDGFAARA